MKALNVGCRSIRKPISGAGNHNSWDICSNSPDTTALGSLWYFLHFMARRGSCWMLAGSGHDRLLTLGCRPIRKPFSDTSNHNSWDICSNSPDTTALGSLWYFLHFMERRGSCWTLAGSRLDRFLTLGCRPIRKPISGTSNHNSWDICSNSPDTTVLGSLCSFFHFMAGRGSCWTLAGSRPDRFFIRKYY